MSGPAARWVKLGGNASASASELAQVFTVPTVGRFFACGPASPMALWSFERESGEADNGCSSARSVLTGCDWPAVSVSEGGECCTIFADGSKSRCASSGGGKLYWHSEPRFLQ
jgi:hypothetical protein